MYSCIKERNDLGFELILGDGKMVSWPFNEFDLACFVKSLEANSVTCIKLRLFKWKYVLGITVKALEPSSLLGVNHGVFAPFNEEH